MDIRSVSIHQPNFLPWIGLVHKIYIADTFVILDNVQFSKNQFQNRNKILTANGVVNLTIPINVESSEQIIKDVKVCHNTNWKKKHLDTIFYAYKKCDYFDDFFSQLEEVYKEDFELLKDFNCKVLFLILEYLQIKKKIIFSSELDVRLGKSKKLLDICIKLNANCYIYGGDSNYLDKSIFINQKVITIPQNFTHPIYSQKHSASFKNNLSILDWIFQVSRENIIFNLMEQKEKFEFENFKQHTFI